MIFDKLEAFSIAMPGKNCLKIQAGIVWGHAKDTNSVYPLIYLTRPKGITPDEFDDLLKHIDISFLKRGHNGI